MYITYTQYITLHTTCTVYTHNIVHLVKAIDINRYLAVVIEQTVRQLLFGPGRSCDPPIPAKPISSARQRRRVSSSGSKGASGTRNDCKIDNDVTKTEGNVYTLYDSNDDDVHDQVTPVRKQLLIPRSYWIS